jgi:anaerobic nitric oxide reductase transcription regulator
VEAAVRVTRLEQQVHALSRASSQHLGEPADEQHLRAALDDSEILGQSEALLRLQEEVKVVAGSDLPVLLLGETGVGKELFARRLHRHSPRRGKPLVHVNCAALPESLAESELFGHRRGAFSGAVTDRPGRFEAAEGGTLFLDEVGELPLSVQAKLLRTLQNGEIQRLGADEPRRVNVRVVAATNRSLRTMCATAAFAPTCTTACRSTRCRFRRCASAATTCCCWPGAFWSSTAPAWACAACACRPRAKRTRCATTTGRATCASWSMWSAAPPSRP